MEVDVEAEGDAADSDDSTEDERPPKTASAAAPNAVVQASPVVLTPPVQAPPMAALKVALGAAPLAQAIAAVVPSWTQNEGPMPAAVTMPGSPFQAIAASEARLMTSLPSRHLESADPGPVSYAPAPTSCLLLPLRRRQRAADLGLLSATDGSRCERAPRVPQLYCVLALSLSSTLSQGEFGYGPPMKLRAQFQKLLGHSAAPERCRESYCAIADNSQGEVIYHRPSCSAASPVPSSCSAAL